MAFFKRKEEEIEEVEEVVETVDSSSDFTLFSMVGDEIAYDAPPVSKKTETFSAPAIVEEAGWAEEFAKLSVEERTEVVEYKEQLSTHFIGHKNRYYLRDNTVNLSSEEEELAKKDFLGKIDYQIKEKNIPKKYERILKDLLCSSTVGYYILDPLIANENVQDIHVYSYDEVCILLRDGVRIKTEVAFLSEKDYIDFVSRVSIRNGRGQSNNNAIIKFTDNTSSPDFKLRFDILTSYVTSGSGQPYLHIRKHPKVKYSVEDLYKFGAFRDDRVKDFILHSLESGDSMLFTGKNNSAKTTMLNALIDEIDEQKNIFIIEDNEELFSDKRGGIVYVHSVENKLEGKVTYTLSELAEVSLLCDVDVVIVGEVKNDSAKGLMKAAYVGAQCFSTSHGQSAIDGYYKLADYVKQATDYNLSDCLRFLAGFKVLVYMEKKRISEIVVVKGLDDKRMPRFATIYDIKKGGWLDNGEN